MKTTVVNITYDICDVYIGRSKIVDVGYFGNPFRIGPHLTRGQSLWHYNEWFIRRLRDDKEFHERILALKGKRLGCFCKPDACHGDIIATYLDFE